MRVAVHHHHLVHRNAETIGDDLRESCFVALALGARASDGSHAAGLLDADQAALEAGAGAWFDERRQPYADQSLLASGRISLSKHRGVVAQLEGFVERFDQRHHVVGFGKGTFHIAAGALLVKHTLPAS